MGLHMTDRGRMAQFAYADRNPADYEEDHLVSLELGGAPRSSRTSGLSPGGRPVGMTMGSQRACTGRSATGR